MNREESALEIVGLQQGDRADHDVHLDSLLIPDLVLGVQEIAGRMNTLTILDWCSWTTRKFGFRELL